MCGNTTMSLNGNTASLSDFEPSIILPWSERYTLYYRIFCAVIECNNDGAKHSY